MSVLATLWRVAGALSDKLGANSVEVQELIAALERFGPPQGREDSLCARCKRVIVCTCSGGVTDRVAHDKGVEDDAHWADIRGEHGGSRGAVTKRLRGDDDGDPGGS